MPCAKAESGAKKCMNKPPKAANAMAIEFTGRLLMVAVRMVISRRFEQLIAKVFQVYAMAPDKQNLTSFGLLK